MSVKKDKVTITVDSDEKADKAKRILWETVELADSPEIAGLIRWLIPHIDIIVKDNSLSATTRKCV